MGGAGGLATDAHGGTIARDTGVRDGEVVGLGGPKEVSHHSTQLVIDADCQSGFSSSNQSNQNTVGSGPGAGLGAGSAQNQNFGAEHSSVSKPHSQDGHH
jgi:hypothetical protein